jgi:hypothetical protein
MRIVRTDSTKVQKFVPAISFFGVNFHHLLTKKSSATHTKDSCEKNVPKFPDFEGKKS